MVLSRRGTHLFLALAALHAAFVFVLWVVAERLHWTSAVPAIMWHAHEMIYGFAAAGMAGVLCALAPEWSDSPLASAGRLGMLAAVWVLGRVAMAASGGLPAWLVATIDLSFLPLFAALLLLPIAARRPGQALPLLLLLAVLVFGNVAMQAEAFGATYSAAGQGARIGLDVYLLLIAAIGGRAIPEATNRFFEAHGSHRRSRREPLLDGLAVAAVLAYLVSDAIAGAAAVTGIAALVAAILNGSRLWLWRGYQALRSPSLLMLHIGYLWMVVGLLLEAVVPVAGGVADMAAIHVLTAGAIGTTLLAVMSRESTLHRGRGITAGPVELAAYGLVSLAALLRVAALFVPGAFIDLVIASGVVWAVGFGVMLIDYLPNVLAPRHSLPPSPVENAPRG
jgi:uncharacterized protein involved in response to NO